MKFIPINKDHFSRVHRRTFITIILAAIMLAALILGTGNSCHTQDSALNLRIPLDSPSSIFAPIASRSYGEWRGLDHRGVDAMAATVPISESGWILVVKQNIAELLEDWRFKAAMIAALFIGLTLGAILIGVFLLVRQRNSHLQNLFDYESRLVENARMTQRYLDVAGTIFLSLDRHGCATMINRHGCMIMGYEESDILGQDWIESFVPEDFASEFKDEFHATMESGSIRQETFKGGIINAEGSVTMIRWHVVPLHDELGTPEGILACGEDVTEEENYRRSLERSERQFKDLFIHMPAAVMIHDKDTGEVVDANPLAMSTNGANSLAELRDQGFCPQGSPYSFKEALANIRKAATDGSHSTKWKNLNRKGELIWENVVLKLIEIDGIERVISMATDITDTVKLEQEIDNFVDMMRYIIEHTNSAVAVHDLELRYIYVSERYLEQYHIKGQQVIGRHYYEVFPGLPERWLDAHRRALAGEVVSGDRDPFYRADGTVEWTRWECRPWFNAAGEIGGIVVYTEVITDQIKSELEIIEQKGLLQAIYDNAPVLLMVVDSDATIRQTNSLNLGPISIDAEEIAGQDLCCGLNCGIGEGSTPDASIMEHRSGCAIRKTAMDTIESGNAILNRMLPHNILIDEKSIEMNLMLSTTPVEIDGRRMALLSIQDITERENLEDQLRQAQKMDSIGRLAGGVAHDFNNMLQAIQGFASLALDDTPETSPVFAYIEQVVKAANRSAELTSQLLAFARKQSVAPQTIDFNEEVGKSIEMLKRLIGENIELKWMPAGDRCKVFMDRSQLNQIITNLTINARDAIKDTGTITIKTEVIGGKSMHKYCDDSADGEFVRLSVTDDGMGIEEAEIEMIFEPFFTTKTNGKGSGLGLSTVYGIVKQNQGFINVDSIPHRGSTFEVVIPRQKSADSGGQQSMRKSTIPSGNGEKIIIVEDEVPVLNLAKTILTKLNYDILACSSPLQAIELHAKHGGKIDLLLTDVVMPEMNGRDMAEVILKADSGIKVVFMSGYSADLISNADKLFADLHFIQKPFSRQILGRKIHEVLNMKKADRSQTA